MLVALQRCSIVCLLAALGCAGRFEGPYRLLEHQALDGASPRMGRVTTGAETRPALLESARYRVALPERGLLTFGAGLDWAGDGEAPGWFQITVRRDGQVLEALKLNPRVARGWRDISLTLDGGSREVDLELELRLTDRHGVPVEQPKELLLAVADPTIHDLDAYGTAPGIVLISIDTLRRDHVGAYGYEKPTTPRLDELARDAVLCEDAVSTSSWTLPAHLSMLTSTDPAIHGGVDMDHGFNGEVPTLPTLLSEAGFVTRAITSHLYVSEVYGLDTGFDHLDFQQDRKATDVANHAMDVLDRFGDRPFFLFLHFYDPHWHYDPPEQTRRLFDEGYSGTLTGIWQDFSKRDRDSLSPDDLEHLLALYDAEIRYTDNEIARVLDHMAERGLERGTLVVVTSDHGEEFLDHGSWEHQKTLYEEVVRVPLLFTGPRVEPRREASQVSLLDVAPTILEWAGVPVPSSAQGRSLLSAVGRRATYGETDHTPDGSHKLFVRAGASGWKAVLSLADEGGEVVSEEWYDLAADPSELRNAAPRAELSDAMRRRGLERWRRGREASVSAPTVRLTEEQQERLRALGYVTR